MFAAMLILSATVPAAVVVSHPGPEVFDGTAGDDVDLNVLYGSVDITTEGSLAFDYQFSALPYYSLFWSINNDTGGAGSYTFYVRAGNGSDFYVELYDWNGSGMSKVVGWNIATGVHDLDPHNFKMTWKDGVGIDVQIDNGTPYTSTYIAQGDGVVESAPSNGFHLIAGFPNWPGNEQFIGKICNFFITDTYSPALLTIVETSGSTQVEEGGATDSFTVQLISAPTATVTITLDPDTDDIKLNSQAPGALYNLTFTTGNWNSPQTVSVSAYDDAIVENDESLMVNILSASADGNFHNKAMFPIIVKVLDNDAPRWTLVASGGSTDVAEQGETSDTYTLVLDLAPTQDVTVNILDQATPDEVAITPDQLIFTTGNWNTPQTVTVTAIDDSFGEDNPNHQTIINHTACSFDLGYNGLVENVTVMVIDNGDIVRSPVLDARHWGIFGGPSSIDFRFYDMTGYDTFNTEVGAQAWWDAIHADRMAGRYQIPILRPGTQERLDMIFSPPGNVTTYPEDLLGIALGHEVTLTADPSEDALYDYIKSNWPKVQVYKFYSVPIMPRSFAYGTAEKCDGYLYDDYYTRNAVEFRRRVMKFLVTGKPLVLTLWASVPDPVNGGFFADDWVEGLPDDEQNGLIINSPNSGFEQYFRDNSDTLREFGMPVALYAIAPAPCCDSNPPWWTGYAISPNLGYIVNEIALPLLAKMHASDGQKLHSAEFSEGYELDDATMPLLTGWGNDGQIHMGIDTSGAYSYVDDFLSDGQYIGLGTIDDASIRGFSNLLQIPDPAGVLTTKDNDEGPGYVELIYRFYATSGSIGAVHAELLSTVVPGQGGVNLLGLSKNGRHITHFVESTPGLGTEETLIINGDGTYANLEAFHVHVRMSYDSSPKGSTANLIRQLDVTALHTAGGTPVPEPGKCGDDGFLASDIMGTGRWNLPDCYVNNHDFSVISADWLGECKPGLIGDISGLSGSSDDYVDMYDLLRLAGQWLNCTDPVGAGCIDGVGSL
jgi:hypothetical protein